MKCLKVLLLVSLLSVLLLAAFSLGWGQEEKKTWIYESELIKLSQIWQALETNNLKLKEQLTNLQGNYESLSNTISELTANSETLRTQLNDSLTASESLSNQLELSEKELTTLREAQQRAEIALTNLETSFNLYRIEANKQISNLETQRNIAIVGGIALAIITALIF
jgi:septal ring factor EnvC (AmiA/AmiB activator)